MTDFVNNKKDLQFEYHVGDIYAVANYRQESTVLYIDYVEAPTALRGKGAAGALMQHIVDFASQHDLTIKPICGYAAAWLARHK